MRLKRSLTDEERNKLRKFLFLKEKADREEEDRDNEAFKKSGWYKFSLSVCFLYLSFLTVAYFLDDRFSNQQLEEAQWVKHTQVETYRRYSKRIYYSFEIKTNTDTYFLSDREYGINVQQGDKIIIERNLFGKPIYYTKFGWHNKFRLDLFWAYQWIFWLTLLSLIFKYWNFAYWTYFLVLFSLIDTIALIAYFVL